MLQAWLTQVLTDNEWWTEDDDTVVVRTEHSGVTDDACGRIARVVFQGAFPASDAVCADCLHVWNDAWRIELVDCVGVNLAYEEEESSKALELQEILASVLAAFWVDKDSLKDPLVNSSKVILSNITPIDLSGSYVGYSINLVYERRMASEDISQG